MMNIGKWKIYPLETGWFRLDGGAMMGSVPKVLWEKTNPADDKNRIDLSLRCLLADDGKNRILIETGMGSKLTDKFKDRFHVRQEADPLFNSLKRVGYIPSQITHVILTHLHFDHAGGATCYDENGELIPCFPNAEYFISQRNWQAGMTPNPRDRASYLKENYQPLESAGVLTLLEDSSTIVDGITTMQVNGHTSGQQLVKISDGKDTLVFTADLIPLRSHLKLPWIMGYDLNAQLTLQEKTDFLNKAASENWWLWFYHDPMTAAVRVQKGSKYFEVIEEIPGEYIDKGMLNEN